MHIPNTPHAASPSSLPHHPPYDVASPSGLPAAFGTRRSCVFAHRVQHMRAPGQPQSLTSTHAFHHLRCHGQEVVQLLCQAEACGAWIEAWLQVCAMLVPSRRVGILVGPKEDGVLQVDISAFCNINRQSFGIHHRRQRSLSSQTTTFLLCAHVGKIAPNLLRSVYCTRDMEECV